MKKSTYRAAGILAAGAVAGAVLAGTISANAAGSGSSGSGSTSSTSTDPRGDHDGDGRGGHAGETVVTGSNADTLKAAALKAVPGATIVRIESDSGDATYEAHMTKSDGTEVTVKFDKTLKVTGVEDGMGK